ncbi:MAG TPA: hypothetical protein VNN16_07160, partial [Candidatus Sulfotelmatobacter sp.]|nr:hypothetical protein [Candidatus Sulfotelmatobacter sp.]
MATEIARDSYPERSGAPSNLAACVGGSDLASMLAGDSDEPRYLGNRHTEETCPGASRVYLPIT